MLRERIEDLRAARLPHMLALLAWEMTGKSGPAPDLEAFCVATAGRFQPGGTERTPASQSSPPPRIMTPEEIYASLLSALAPTAEPPEATAGD